MISGHAYAIIDLYEFNILYKQGTIYESGYIIRNYKTKIELLIKEIEEKDNNIKKFKNNIEECKKIMIL